MDEHLVVELVTVIGIGISAQWLAWRFRLPSIILLLLFGIIAGPVTGLVHPDRLLGELLFPFISLAVGIILFEGGLNLSFSELKTVGRAVIRLCTLGVIATWAFATIAAHYILNLEISLALLLGAILVVTGPTVIMPLLRQVRPNNKVSATARWEGIVTDPFGAILAVLVFDMLINQEVVFTSSTVPIGVFESLIVGVSVGLLGAALIAIPFGKYWVPDHLQSPITLMIVLGVFVMANEIHPESGLLSVTVMGVVLANQSFASVQSVAHFKENLQVLLISILFILLAARLRVEDLEYISSSSLLFLATLILVVRPLAVFISTIGTELSFKEKIFLSCLAPRGIVAAAVASIFSLKLVEQGYTAAEQIAPLVFLVIIGTVTFYGIIAAPLAYMLGLAERNPQGVLIVGAHRFSRTLALTLSKFGIEVLLVDTNWSNVTRSRIAGLRAVQGNITSESFVEHLRLSGIGRLLAITPNTEANSLAVLRFKEVFETSEMYQLVPAKDGTAENASHLVDHLHGRFLFNDKCTFEMLRDKIVGSELVEVRLEQEADIEKYSDDSQNSYVPMFMINEAGSMVLSTVDQKISPKVGDTVIAVKV